MSEMSICPRCGGQKVVYIKIEPGYNTNYTAAALAVTTSSVHICVCPMPRPKHDGKLNKNGSVHVHFDDEIPFEDGCVHLANERGGGMSLLASEALSLLAWLEGERDTLEQLAKGE